MTRRAMMLSPSGEVLEISKAAKIKLKNDSFIHLDKLQDGTWRLLYTEDVDISKIDCLKMLRED